MLLKMLGQLALFSGQEGGEEGKETLVGFPEGAGDQLLVYSYLWFRACLWASGFSVPGELSVFFQLL